MVKGHQINSLFTPSYLRPRKLQRVKPAVKGGIAKSGFFFLLLFKRWFTVVLVIALLLQLIIFPAYGQVWGCITSAIGWTLCMKLILTPNIIKKYTLSSLVLIGFAITQFWIPPVLTLIEGKPLVFNLKYPNSVFLHNLLAFFIILVSFYFYTTFFQRIRYSLSNFFLKHTQLYATPYNYQLWLMGFIGVAGMSITRIFGAEGGEEAGIMIKIIQGLSIYAYAPLYIFLAPLYLGQQKNISNNSRPFLIGYVFFLLLIGILMNSRGAFMQGLAGLGISYLLGLLLGCFPHRIFTFRNTLLFGASLWIITGPLSDLGTAMVIARSQRGEVNPTELLNVTLRIYQDKEQLNAYKSIALDQRNSLSLEWNEYYFDNIFAARFSNLKFVDASLEHYYRLDSPSKNESMYRYSIDRTLAILPSPVLNFLNIEIDKYKVIGSSYGDYLLALSTGNQSYLGGYRVGHFAGVGMAAFGWTYLLIMLLALTPNFLLLDLLYHKGKFSIVSLIFIPKIFSHVGLLSGNIENPINFIPFLFRTWPQLVILYLILFYLTRLLRKFIL